MKLVEVFVGYLKVIFYALLSFSILCAPYVIGAHESIDNREHIHDFYDRLPPELKKITNIEGQEIRSVSGDLTFVKEIEMEPANYREVMSIVSFMTQQQERKIVVGAGNFQSGSGGYQGLSIGGHAQGIRGDVYLSTRKLKVKKLKSTDYKFNADDETITITVGGGNSWQEAMELANSTLTPDESEKFIYVPFCAPTSDQVSIAGSLTSHGHSRSSAFGGGYMPEEVEQFSLVTRRGSRVVKLSVSRTTLPELFYALPGSFGRGGIVTDVTLRLQRIPKNSRVSMTVTRYDDYPTLVKDYLANIKMINESAELRLPVQRPFASTFVSVTSTGSYYLYFSKLVSSETAKSYPYFDFFEKPGVGTSIIQAVAHNFTKMANSLMDGFITGLTNSKTYKNHPVPWIFAQDSFLKFTKEYEKYKLSHEHMILAHQAYVLPRKSIEAVLNIAKSLQKKYADEYDLLCKMEDIVALNSSPFVMAPAYHAKDSLFIYTFTWPIKNQEQKAAVLQFRAEFLKQCDEDPDIGPNLVRSHMLKEFEKDSLLIYQTYKNQVDKLESILHKHDIDDGFMWNNVFGTLFQRKRDDLT